jgi:hypothetical protein
MARLPDQPESPARTRRRRAKDPLLTETILGVLAVVFVMLAVLLLFSMVGAGGQGGEILFRGIYFNHRRFSYFSASFFIYIAYYLMERRNSEVALSCRPWELFSLL